jgi:hypothetical protein
MEEQMSTNTVRLMSERPPVRMICYTDSHGNPHEYQVGSCDVTAIREVEENGEYSTIPWIEVWAGDKLLARFNQHKLEHIFYI